MTYPLKSGGVYVNAPDTLLYDKLPLPLAKPGVPTLMSVNAMPPPPAPVESAALTHLLVALSYFNT